MSKDWDEITLRCRKCHSEGRLTKWMDDWCRWGVGELTGFKGRVFVIDSEFCCLICEKCGESKPIGIRDTVAAMNNAEK